MIPKDVRLLGSNVQVGQDATATWANSAAANTEQNVDVAQPDNLRSRYRVQIHNPSLVTALTVVVRHVVSLGGTARYAKVTEFVVPAGATVETLVEALFGGTDGTRVVLSNDTALGTTDGFTADVAIREA